MSTTHATTQHIMTEPSTDGNGSRDDRQRAIARYLRRIPREVPGAEIVVHNHVRPCLDPNRRAEGIETMADLTLLGLNGFRAWRWPEGDERAVPCDCGWAPQLAVHYRVKAMGDSDSEAASR